MHSHASNAIEQCPEAEEGRGVAKVCRYWCGAFLRSR